MGLAIAEITDTRPIPFVDTHLVLTWLTTNQLAYLSEHAASEGYDTLGELIIDALKIAYPNMGN